MLRGKIIILLFSNLVLDSLIAPDLPDFLWHPSSLVLIVSLRQLESVFGPCNKKLNELRLTNLASVLRSYNSLTKLTQRTFSRKNNDKNFSYVHDRNNFKQMWRSFLLSSYQLILCTRNRYWSILQLEMV